MRVQGYLRDIQAVRIVLVVMGTRLDVNFPSIVVWQTSLERLGCESALR